jgi:hypothetical protein
MFINMSEFKKTIDVILNPTTTFVSKGLKTVIAIPKEEKVTKISIRN